MKRDQDWLDELGGMLREAETPPPPGGWERLERELPAAPEGPWFIRRWHRVAAVAAVVLICVAVGDSFRRARRVYEGDVRFVVASAAADSTSLVSKNNAETIDVGAEPFLPTEQEDMTQPGERIAAAPSAARHLAEILEVTHVQRATKSEPDEIPEEIAAAAEGESRGTPYTNDRVRACRSASSRTDTALGSEKAVCAHWAAAPAGKRVSRGKAALGLFAGGGMTSSGSRVRGTNTFMSNAAIPGTGVNLMKYDYRDCSYDHKLPLSFGLTFRREFPYGLSLESGVVYSLLRSEVAVPYADGKLQQRLHFIGIPLRVNWRMFDRSGFSLYIGAGAMAEKCVSACFGKETVTEKGLQGSVFGLAGVQYRLGGPAALYFEPEVSYYFTQTELRTSRTDSPVSLSLQVGVRFSF